MPKLDQTNTLIVTDVTEKGITVDGREYGDLFLREPPKDVAKHDKINVFLYKDASDRITATGKLPVAQVGECAYLRVVSTNEYGAFLDWGVPKDLLLPFSEQAFPVKEGDSCVVYIHINAASGRVIASSTLHHYLEEDHDYLKVGDAVDLMISGRSELGFKAVINHKQLGLIYHDGLSQPLRFGSRMRGWVKNIREDGLVDLSINSLDKKTRDQLEQRILTALEKADGRLFLSDKSSPEDIFKIFKVSKKNFKRALGSLYKQRLIVIKPDSIFLGSDKPE